MSYLHISTTKNAPWRTESGTLQVTDAAPSLLVTGRTDQVWRGWGGCFNELGWKALAILDQAGRDAILKDLFEPGGNCRFNLCRLPIGANDYSTDWYSMNERDGDFAMEHFSIERDRVALIPYIRSAKKLCPELKLFASPWSPPTWMKRPAVYNFGSFVMKEEYLRAYALYFLKFVKAYEAEGLPVAQVHVQNEPVSTQKFPSCIWTGEQLKIFIRDYLGPLFEENGVDTEIWLGTINGPETDNRFLTTTVNHYANLVLEDAKARSYVRGIGYQWAGKYAMQRTRQAWPGLPLMQTENECGDGRNTWDYAFYVFDLFYHYISNGADAYIYWNMVLESGGESTWGWKQNSLFTVDPETGAASKMPEYYVMRHFSQFIRPGDTRLQLEGRWSANAVAFKHAGSTVLVVRNPFKEGKVLDIGTGGRNLSCALAPESINTIVI